MNDLDRVLLLVVDVDPLCSIRRRALRRNVLELDRADDVPAFGIDCDERSHWAAVVRQNDLIVKLVVQMPSRPPFGTLIFLMTVTEPDATHIEGMAGG